MPGPIVAIPIISLSTVSTGILPQVGAFIAEGAVRTALLYVGVYGTGSKRVSCVAAALTWGIAGMDQRPFFYRLLTYKL